MEVKKLAPRQYALRRYLWNHRTEWTSSKDIYKAVPGYETEKTAYKQINKDVKAINMSGLFYHIIITNRAKGYKIPTKKEFWDWARKAYCESMGKLQYLHALLKMAKSDGQGILPHLESFQEEVYDRFAEDGEEGSEAEI